MTNQYFKTKIFWMRIIIIFFFGNVALRIAFQLHRSRMFANKMWGEVEESWILYALTCDHFNNTSNSIFTKFIEIFTIKCFRCNGLYIILTFTSKRFYNKRTIKIFFYFHILAKSFQNFFGNDYLSDMATHHS